MVKRGSMLNQYSIGELYEVFIEYIILENAVELYVIYGLKLKYFNPISK
jgi:hypothetical protein